MARNALMEFLQSASNEAAGAISGPVDLLGMGLRGIGVPVPRNALLSSDWMAQQGLTRPVQQGAAQVAGATAGLLSPFAAAAKAPQIAAGLLQAGRNAAASRTIAGPSSRQRGMILADDSGAPELFHHGTSRDFDQFQKEYGGSVWDDAASRAGFFFTKDKSEADYFAQVAAGKMGGTPKIVSANIDANNMRTITPDDLSRHTERWLNSLPDAERDFQLATRSYDAVDGGISKGLELAILDAKSRGHDAARITLDDGTDWVVTFSNKTIKRAK